MANFQAEKDVPTNHFLQGQIGYNFVADRFHTKKLCRRLFPSALFDRKWPFAFFSPPLGAKGQCMLFILGSLESSK